MIKFIPVKHPNAAFLAPNENDRLNQIHNIANANLSKQLQDKLGDRSCSFHPTFENQIEIDLANETDPMRVIASCCESFKKKLDLVAQNKKAEDW